MDAILADSGRATRSSLYQQAYDVARGQIEQSRLWCDHPDPAAVIRRLIAMVGHELGDDGTARLVIGRAAEDAVAGWRPDEGARCTPGMSVRDGAGPRAHDGTLGRAGELRGRPEPVSAVTWPVEAESMILDGRDDETPRQAVERRYGALMLGRGPGHPSPVGAGMPR